LNLTTSRKIRKQNKKPFCEFATNNVGIDFILGLENNFKEIPFNISIDWKPAYNLTGYSGFWADGGAISIRYIF